MIEKKASLVSRSLRRLKTYYNLFKKRVWIFLGLIGLISIAKLSFLLYFKHMMVPPPLTVVAEKALKEKWHDELQVIGSLAATESVVLTPEIGGTVEEIYINSGQYVKKGDLILKLNDAAERADFVRYSTQLVLSQATFERALKLSKKNVETQASLEQKEAQRNEHKAGVEQAKAIIAKKNLVAPFDGYLGIRQVNVGQYLQPGTPIVTLTNAEKLHINFSVPERFRPHIVPGQTIYFKVEAFTEENFKGTVQTIEPQGDEKTRNFNVQAFYENKGLRLSSGMFADVRVISLEEKDVVTIPEIAVDYSLHGTSVYVLEPKIISLKSPEHKHETEEKPQFIVRRVAIKTGEVKKGRVAVLSGLQGSEQVVTVGALKLYEGASVVLSSSRTPPTLNSVPKV